MTPRPIWYTPHVGAEYAALAYRMPIGWLVRFETDRVRWRWVHRLSWSNHFDRI